MFDQYEIDVEMTKHRHSYINSGITKKLIELDLAFYDRTDKGYKSNVISGTESPPPLDHHDFGLWDAIYNSGF